MVGYEGSPGSCAACTEGTYRDALNISSCLDCPEDKSTNGTGADTLDKCGQYTWPGPTYQFLGQYAMIEICYTCILVSMQRLHDTSKGINSKTGNIYY